jgi:CheY-like chemotaxis protein
MKRILIVDDEIDTLNLLRMILELSGYQAFTTLNSVDAITLAEIERPDCILLDIMMPQLYCLTLCKMMRLHPSTANLPIVFVTAYSALDLDDRRKEAGADLILPKPIGMETLIETVEQAIQLRAAPQNVPPDDLGFPVGNFAKITPPVPAPPVTLAANTPPKPAVPAPAASMPPASPPKPAVPVVTPVTAPAADVAPKPTAPVTPPVAAPAADVAPKLTAPVAPPVAAPAANEAPKPDAPVTPPVAAPVANELPKPIVSVTPPVAVPAVDEAPKPTAPVTPPVAAPVAIEAPKPTIPTAPPADNAINQAADEPHKDLLAQNEKDSSKP